MKIAAAVALLHLCLSATVSGDDSTETTVTASPGDVALLPCYTSGNVTPSVTTWEKNGRERLTVLHDGSLNINGVTPGDEGSYLCASTLPGNIAFHARVLLQVTDGPDRVSTSIDPGHVLPNGTIIVYQGSSISFNCSASSYPSQQLTWAFTGASSSNVSLTSGSRAWLVYRIEDVQPSAQGVYSCTANNTVSYQAVNRSSQLLVYYAPDRHPECMWSPAQDPSYIQFTCSWSGAYPTPTLSWEGDGGAQGKDTSTQRR
ncbi:hypothetical protein INR49_000866 [Caranx melampygus]|nr:hypothetical protein INR49_000866 [Caranx melampygus]